MRLFKSLCFKLNQEIKLYLNGFLESEIRIFYVIFVLFVLKNGEVLTSDKETSRVRNDAFNSELVNSGRRRKNHLELTVGIEE